MQSGVPAGGFVARKRTAENRAGNHQNPTRAFNTTPASTDPQNARPPTCTHASNNETATQPRAGKHPINTPQTAVKNPMNKIGQPPERKRPTQPTRWTKSHKRTPMQSPINQNRSKRVKTPIKTPEKYPKVPKSTFLFIKSDILCMLPRQMIKIGHLAPAQCGKWPKMFTGTFSPFLSAKINTNTITFFKIAIIYVQ